ncbi:MAG: LuxR C-terminal-related transcriptional regulator [Actinophytocola sp.]|uniref:LuxR family transcriptional regulator n=1 Tax=Actinophytocola sp. TaxID=1872138 RepID=UPI003C741665
MSVSPADGEPDETELLADVLATIELALAHSAASQELVKDACAALRRLVDARGNAHAAEAAGPDLTRRQRQVLRLVQCGSSNRDIASELSISERTVKQHLHMAFTKLGVQNRAQAAAAGNSMEGRNR